MNIVLMDDKRPVIIGSGTIGTAPPADSVANGVLWVDEFGTAWQSNGSEWIPTYGILTINGEPVTIGGDPVYYLLNSEILVDENGNILVDENNFILLGGLVYA